MTPRRSIRGTAMVVVSALLAACGVRYVTADPAAPGSGSGRRGPAPGVEGPHEVGRGLRPGLVASGRRDPHDRGPRHALHGASGAGGDGRAEHPDGCDRAPGDEPRPHRLPRRAAGPGRDDDHLRLDGGHMRRQPQELLRLLPDLLRGRRRRRASGGGLLGEHRSLSRGARRRPSLPGASHRARPRARDEERGARDARGPQRPHPRAATASRRPGARVARRPIPSGPGHARPHPV